MSCILAVITFATIDQPNRHTTWVDNAPNNESCAYFVCTHVHWGWHVLCIGDGMYVSEQNVQ
jgi:hypothetical protein